MRLLSSKKRTQPTPTTTKTKHSPKRISLHWLRNLKIRTKLIIGFLLSTCITLAVGLISFSNIQGFLQNDEYLYDEAVGPSAKAIELVSMYQESRVAIRDLLNATSEERRTSQKSILDADFAALDEAYQSLVETSKSPEIVALLTDFDANYKTFRSRMDNIVNMAMGGKAKEANGLLYSTSTENSVNALNVSVDALKDKITERGSQITQENIAEAQKSELIMAIILAMGFVISLGLALIVSGAISRPLRKTADAARKLAEGDTSATLEVRGKDETGVLAQAVQQAVLSISAMVQDANMLAQAAAEGRLSVRADASRHQGDYRRIVEGVNQTLDLVVGPLNTAAAQLNLISRGENMTDLDPDEYPGDFRQIIEALLNVRQALNWMLDDVIALSDAARRGELSTRADAGRHLGGYSNIVSGVNGILDAVLSPIGETTAVLQRMAHGDLSARVQGDYVGDHAQIKVALNGTQDALQSYVSEISAVLNEMAAGNLEVSIDADYRGDFGPIKDSLNNIVYSLNDMLDEMARAAEQVAAGTSQVSDGSQALSQGATEQASAIEELTVSVAEIARQTKENAMNAAKASDLTITARDEAVAGNSQMKAMQRSMEEINESSASISKIIKVIDDIAFQTNLLALNAAVEAARAGQHGKGFAVVAEEVRSLAARSATAAKETTDLIENSVKRAEQGTKIADETAQALEKIVSGVESATDLVSGIAQASNDQALAVSQVNRGIEQVSQVVQTTSATAEESAATSEELSSQAELLKERVGRFHLKNSGATTSQTKATQAALPGPAGKAKPKISFDESDFGKY